MTTTFIIQPARLSDDGEALFALAIAFATSFTVERSTFDLSFTELLQAPVAFLAVAAEGDKVIGYLLGFDHLTRSFNSTYIGRNTKICRVARSTRAISLNSSL